jgi:predicted acyl esterase
MHATSIAGTGPGQRRLNGPQTTGRTYRNLSPAEHAIASELDVAVPMRDGIELLADVFRPDGDPGPVPALIAASCYPRQIQNLGAPIGFVEAGATDFWVPRGYAHVVANVRGTGGSGGTYGFLDQTEREDMHDLVEWVAAQPWCDGRVGMVGISYFAMTQLAAATQRPAHLRALFPVAATADLYEAVYHHGLFSATFINGWLSGVGMLADKPNDAFRGRLSKLAERILHAPPVHRRFEHLNGEAALAVLSSLMRGSFDADPFGDLWAAAAIEHPTRDAFWEERDLRPGLEGLDLPVYLGCDWENVPLHLPSTFKVWEILERAGAPVRMGMLGKDGLTWPWESLHEEALAWFDHWLKDADTGILEGPAVRYVLPGADGFREASTWPPPQTEHVELALAGDGRLGGDAPGDRSFVVVPGSLPQPKGSPGLRDLAHLTWETEPLAAPVELAGPIELRLDATTTAQDTDWIAVLQEVEADGTAHDITSGWLRASLRAVDEAASAPGAPEIPCAQRLPVPAGELVAYRIALVPNARHVPAGYRLRLVLLGDDSPKDAPAMMGFRHTPLGIPARNTVHASSRLLLPLTAGAFS